MEHAGFLWSVSSLFPPGKELSLNFLILIVVVIHSVYYYNPDGEGEELWIEWILMLSAVC